MRNTLGFCRSTSVRAHEDDALQPEARADRRRRHAVLARAGLGDDPGLAHAPGQQDLAEHVVDLVRAGVVQLVALEVDLRAAEPLASAARRSRAARAGRRSASRGRPSRPRRRRRSWRVSYSASRSRISGISVSETKRPPKSPNRPALVGPGAKGVGLRAVVMAAVFLEFARASTTGRGARVESRRRSAARQASGAARRPRRAHEGARSAPGPCSPGRHSTPDDTSTWSAPVSRTASATLSGVRPAGQHPRPPPAARRGSAASRRSAPLPPGRSASARRRARRPAIWSATRNSRRSARRSASTETPIAFITGSPKRSPHLGDPLRRSRGRAAAACRSDSLDDRLERVVVGIDGQRHPDQPIGHACGDPARVRRASGGAARAERRRSPT